MFAAWHEVKNFGIRFAARYEVANFGNIKPATPCLQLGLFSNSMRNEVRLRNTCTLASMSDCDDYSLSGDGICLGNRQSPSVSSEGGKRPDYLLKADDQMVVKGRPQGQSSDGMQPLAFPAGPEGFREKALQFGTEIPDGC